MTNAVYKQPDLFIQKTKHTVIYSKIHFFKNIYYAKNLSDEHGRTKYY